LNNDFQAQRRQVIEACLQLAEQGFLAGTGGNVAVRLDAEHFAVTPSAADYYTLTPANIAVLRLADLRQVAGDLPPSVESGLHATLLRAKPAMQASVHTHQPLASAVALIDAPLASPEATIDAADAAELGRLVAVVRYAPSGTELLVGALRRRLKADVHAYLLRNHGLICAAPTLGDAVTLVGHIERAAAAWLHHQALRLPPGQALRQLAISALSRSASE
jgi:L-fuculose-phosphate aldolase